MPLNAGARLGPYEIVGALGAGGMGEVYRARDTKLGRDVALKIIPDAFALDPDRVARFKREAQVLASLNDPHIAAIYGFEDSGETHALVLELVEGDTLAEHIAHGPGHVGRTLSGSPGEPDPPSPVRGFGAAGKARPTGLPVAEALPIARQIAEALEAAHEHGIIHRDLKPANIKITPDGVVKVLDFGLAKLHDPNASNRSSALSLSPTLTSPAMTGAGTLLGTAAYMAPEQAKGRPADKRSDVWAFGCVLYEMLTGRRAFDGEDMVDVLGAVARLDPNWEALPSDVPQPVRMLLHSCLVKDRRHRVADISTALFVLDKAASLAAPVGTVSAAPPARRPLWRRALPIAAGVVVGGLMTALAGTYIRVAPVEPLETRLEITTPPGRLSFSRLSPDGRKIVFSAASEGKAPQLWVRSLEAEEAQPLSGTDNAEYPFWSPDSRSLGFVAGGNLVRVDLAGGSPRVLADAQNAPGGAWSPDGTIVFTPTATSPLLRVPSTGGAPVALTRLKAPGDASHRFPDFLPDGRHFLFFVAGTAAAQGIYVGSLDTSDTRRLVASDSAAVFAPPDYVLFRRQETLVAQRLDMETLEVVGDSFSVAPRASGDQGTMGELAVSTSQTGLIAYRAPLSVPRQLTWFDRAGRTTGTVGDVDVDGYVVGGGFRISPDGRTVGLRRIVNGNLDVWLVETARGIRRRFTSDPAGDGNLVWAPDSNRVVFHSRRSGPQNLWFKRVDGGTDVHLRESTANEVPMDWSPDGRFVLFSNGARDLWAVPLDGDKNPIVVANTSFAEDQGRFSPDSRRVAYQSNESGRNEVYVVPFPGPGVPMQVSTNGGVWPQWRNDGREIFYLAPDNRLMAVPVMPQSNGTLEVATPTALFPVPQEADYDITPDGQRILLNKPVGQATTPPITIIQNWKPRS